ncbi:MAG: hypothetical protein Kow00108_26390 [Calditrichia bacterium]
MKKASSIVLLVVSFIWIPLIIWGSFMYAPSAKGLGHTARIIFYHVPLAWISVVAFFISAWYSWKVLQGINQESQEISKFDTFAATAAELGLLFAFLATVTGSIWAKKIWGSYWNWDPRETSIFILLIIYGAYFALRTAITNPQDKLRLSAVYSLIAVVTVPFFVFIVPRIFASLHPDPLINEQGKIHMDGKMLLVFLNSLAAFTIMFFYIYKTKIKIKLLQLTISELEEEYE